MPVPLLAVPPAAVVAEEDGADEGVEVVAVVEDEELDEHAAVTERYTAAAAASARTLRTFWGLSMRAETTGFHNPPTTLLGRRRVWSNELAAAGFDNQPLQASAGDEIQSCNSVLEAADNPARGGA